MILINFSHPFSPQQIAQIEVLSGQSIDQVLDIAVHLDNLKPFLPQLQELVTNIPLDPRSLQTEPVLVNPPALNFITALLVAELHGRMGYFPSILRVRPVPESLPTQYEIAEILNLQDVRDSARQRRF